MPDGGRITHLTGLLHLPADASGPAPVVIMVTGMELTFANGIPHVQISKVGNPTECKLISVTTLHDGY
ncbi:MAG: hypothetical protein O7D27_04065, partial [Alphaproteobacteria bacterium]|nr:hypothetical protein [Alphaproteobacteria bacterium]